MKNKIKAILFDLDGTLLDTAPDLVAAVNETLRNNGFDAQPFVKMRAHAGHGSTSLICHGFNIDKTHPQFENYKREFLAIYERDMTLKTTFFSGMQELLHQLDDKKIPWGVVTNKPSYLTLPLLEHFGLAGRTHCIVSGDTLIQRKPEPEPLWHACKIIKVAPQFASYIGDNENDLLAAKAAGLYAIAALYGYWLENPSPQLNLADYVIQSPLEILNWMNKDHERFSP